MFFLSVSSTLSVARQLAMGEISTLILDMATAGWKELPGTLAEGVCCGEFILMRAFLCVTAPLACFLSPCLSVSLSKRPAPVTPEQQNAKNKTEIGAFSQVICQACSNVQTPPVRS